MTNEGRIVIAVLCVLSISALLGVLGIQYVRSTARALEESKQTQITEGDTEGNTEGR